jgi:hypothetical protein
MRDNHITESVTDTAAAPTRDEQLRVLAAIHGGLLDDLWPDDLWPDDRPAAAPAWVPPP